MIAILAGISAGLFATFIIPLFQRAFDSRAREKYLRKFENAFPNALTMMKNCLRSGLSLAQSLERVSSQRPFAPVSDEFAGALRQYKMGMNLEEALSGLTDRINSKELSLMLTSILVARKTGGNLAETFDKLSATIRERHRIRERVGVLTSQGKMQAIVVGALPLALGIVLTFLSPELISPLFTTSVGRLMLTAVVILEISGAALIQRIVRIDI